jgi:hypothetical protein
MSKNSKNARRTREAKERNRTKGYKGPARTAKQTTKVKTWFAALREGRKQGRAGAKKDE